MKTFGMVVREQEREGGEEEDRRDGEEMNEG